MSSPYRRIACCIDRDGMEDAVLREGLALAAGRPGVVHAVHALAPPSALVTGPFVSVPPTGESREGAEAWLAELAGRYPGIATTTLLEGSPSREVCAWAEREGVDLLIAAARRGLMERVVVGGFASHLAYHAPCAVMILHQSAPVPDDAPAPPARPPEAVRA